MLLPFNVRNYRDCSFRKDPSRDSPWQGPSSPGVNEIVRCSHQISGFSQIPSRFHSAGRSTPWVWTWVY